MFHIAVTIFSVNTEMGYFFAFKLDLIGWSKAGFACFISVYCYFNVRLFYFISFNLVIFGKAKIVLWLVDETFRN